MMCKTRKGINCKCGGDTEVTYSFAFYSIIHRKRKCLTCGDVIETEEEANKVCCIKDCGRVMRVIRSWPLINKVGRRRKCLGCNGRTTSYERKV